MTSWKRWNLALAIGLVVAGASVPAFNLILDPYSVLGTADWMRQGYNVNERFRKVEHLRTHPGEHDSYILGSSIMGLFPPEVAQEVHPDGHWYNLAFLAGTPPEALRALKFLKAQGQPIKEVMFGIDMFAFRKLEGTGSEPWKREHPMVTGESWAKWRTSQVLASTFMDGLEKVGHNFNKQPRLSFDVDGTGRYFLLNWDREIATDHAAFIARQITGKHNGDGSAPKRSTVAFIQERFDELGELKQWLDDNGVKSHFWVNPMHRKNMATLSEASIEDFRQRVTAAVGEVRDYSKRADFCDNDELFYEWKHFRPVAAAQIMREVLAAADGRAPPEVNFESQKLVSQR